MTENKYAGLFRFGFWICFGVMVCCITGHELTGVESMAFIGVIAMTTAITSRIKAIMKEMIEEQKEKK